MSRLVEKESPFLPVPVANGHADVSACKLRSHSMGEEMLEEKEHRS